MIAHAERNGQIAGINTNGRRLKDAAYLNELVTAGLDHVQITLESHDPAIHDGMVSPRGSPGAWNDTVAGLKNALATKNLYVMTNTTLLNSNAPYLAQTLQFLGELGVPTIGLNALIYSGQRPDGWHRSGRKRPAAPAGPGAPLNRKIWSAPDLVYPHPILPLRPGSNGAGRQGLLGGAV